MSSSSTINKTILFLGASGDSGFSALRRSLDAGYTCIAVCRTPERLTSKFPNPDKLPTNLTILQGDAKDAVLIRRAVVNPKDSTKFVDAICFTIGLLPSWQNMVGKEQNWSNVCTLAMTVLLDVISNCRKDGITGRPRIVAMSTTGLSTLKRDVPLLFAPMYYVLLHTPHKDKKAMESMLFKSGEDATVVRASLLTDGADSTSPIRVGIEDSQRGILESREVGYTISREDVGKWIFEDVLRDDRKDLVGKVASITY